MLALAFICQLLVSVFAGVDDRTEVHAEPTNRFGYPHGTGFDDKHYAEEHHRRMSSIKLYGCGPGDHVTEMQIGWRDNAYNGDEDDFVIYHGKHYANQVAAAVTLKIPANAFITELKIRTWERKGHTRIGFLKFTLNTGASISCGQDYASDPSYTIGASKKDKALLYFSGSAGDSIDALTAYWIPVGDL